MTAMLVKTFRKQVLENRRIYIDYSCWLGEGEALTDFQVNVTPYTQDAPLVPNTAYPNPEHTKLVMFVAGGKVNTSYTLSLLVKTTSGQVKQDDIGMKVTP
jgi:hypothetical protein